jgi:hypothetical protein
VAIFAVSEIEDDYLVVSHTRNTKGYVSLQGTGSSGSDFRLGQLIIACVNAEIGGA